MIDKTLNGLNSCLSPKALKLIFQGFFVEFIRSFERNLFKFISNEKADKIKRSTPIQGLKIIDFENFINIIRI